MWWKLIPIVGEVLDRVLPDREAKDKAKAELMRVLAERETEITRAAADIVKAEAASAHWLAATWRPITALAFVALVVSRWLGWTAPGMSEAEYLEVYDIIKIMIGGYVVSRGAEKVADRWKGN